MSVDEKREWQRVAALVVVSRALRKIAPRGCHSVIGRAKAALAMN